MSVENIVRVHDLLTPHIVEPHTKERHDCAVRAIFSDHISYFDRVRAVVSLDTFACRQESYVTNVVEALVLSDASKAERLLEIIYDRMHS
jgi:hypothetical protein